MGDAVEWTATERLAFTELDGPGRPPGGVGPWYFASAATMVGCVLGVVFFADSLCPEHRLWVEILGGMGIVLGITACVALVRGSASAPLLTLASAVAGMGIGAVDTAHDHFRGSIVLAGFAVVGLATAVPLLIEYRAARWQQRGVASLAPIDQRSPVQGVDTRGDVPEAPIGVEHIASGNDARSSAAPSDATAN